MDEVMEANKESLVVSIAANDAMKAGVPCLVVQHKHAAAA